jgi:hypothetical protein
MRSKREADEFKSRAKSRNAGDEDVEGHSMLPNPMLGRELAKAREQEIRRSLRDRQFEQEARRPHKKD